MHFARLYTKLTPKRFLVHDVHQIVVLFHNTIVVLTHMIMQLIKDAHRHQNTSLPKYIPKYMYPNWGPNLGTKCCWRTCNQALMVTFRRPAWEM